VLGFFIKKAIKSSKSAKHPASKPTIKNLTPKHLSKSGLPTRNSKLKQTP
jgi:hypothetical protein